MLYGGLEGQRSDQRGAQSDSWGQDEALGLEGAPEHWRVQSHMEVRPGVAQLCPSDGHLWVLIW